MSIITPIKSALISVFYKDQLDVLAQALHKNNVTIYSTGGTETFINDLGINEDELQSKGSWKYSCKYIVKNNFEHK